MSIDPLVHFWRTSRRPLNWRPWAGLSDADQAWQRWCVIDELQWIDLNSTCLGAYHWQHAHRELLELKAACGMAQEKVQGDGC